MILESNDEFNGQCAFGVYLGKEGVPGGKYPLEINGKRYTFSNKPVRFFFKNFSSIRAKAHANWFKFNNPER